MITVSTGVFIAIVAGSTIFGGLIALLGFVIVTRYAFARSDVLERPQHIHGDSK